MNPKTIIYIRSIPIWGPHGPQSVILVTKIAWSLEG